MIRMSGPRALEIADSTVSFKTGAAQSSEGYTLKYGTVYDGPDGSAPVLDTVLVSIFRAPLSYTGEDSVEISCHASSYIASRILSLLVDAGARMAGPGEFTMRAFANGKMDLAQAESVADLVAASSASAQRLAMNQMRGVYSSRLRELRDRLVEMASLLELELDFSEEDVEFASRGLLETLLDETVGKIEKLADSFKTGNAIKNGVPVAIVGPVNAGKSTLLNALVGEERAIVSDEAGTTRDTVEETIVSDGILFRFIDTAGIRETSGKIEKIGIGRSLESISKAEIVIVLLDATAITTDSAKFVEMLRPRLESSGAKVFYVRNKTDLVDTTAPGLSPAFIADAVGAGTVLDISAATGSGLDTLRSLLSAARKDTAGTAGSEPLVSNIRHYEALRRAADCLYAVRSGLRASAPTDLLAQDLREGIAELGSIFGDVTSDEVLGEIFGKFCIGK